MARHQRTSLSRAFQGVTFTFTKAGPNGTELAAGWQKAAVDAPNYARLVGDGLTVTDGAAGSQIQLTLKGLAAGNTACSCFTTTRPGTRPPPRSTSWSTARPWSARWRQSVGALINDAGPSSYVAFTAQAGKDVVLLYRSTGSIMLNGFQLDTPSFAAQSTSPTPADRDEHVDADAGKLALSWKAAKLAVSHDVYFGTDPDVVQAAGHASPEFKGNQATTTYGVSDLFSIERYYWRIDEVDGQGGVTRGNTWYFRPRQVAFPGAEGLRPVRGRGPRRRCRSRHQPERLGRWQPARCDRDRPRTAHDRVRRERIIPLAGRLSLTQNYVTVAGPNRARQGHLHSRGAVRPERRQRRRRPQRARAAGPRHHLRRHGHGRRQPRHHRSLVDQLDD